MTEQNSKAKYAKFLRSPVWNAAVFSPEGYLVCMTNLDPKDDRSFFHKQQQTLLDLDWVASPEAGTLLCGTRSGSDLVDIKFLEKPDDKWVVNEAKTKEAETKFKETNLISIHTTSEDCLPLYTLSQKLAEHKVVIDTGAGYLVDISKETEFDPTKFSTAFDKLVAYLLADPTKIFEDFGDEDKESHGILERIGCESNLITKTALRKGKWSIPGVDVVPQWTTLAYTKPGAVDEAGKGGSGQRRPSVTPKDKLNALNELLTSTDGPLLALQGASKTLGYVLTPQETLSIAVAAATGVYIPFTRGVVIEKDDLAQVLKSAEVPSSGNEDTVDSVEDGGDDHLELFNQVKQHSKWDPKNTKLRKLLTLDYEIEPSDLNELGVAALRTLLKDLDSL